MEFDNINELRIYVGAVITESSIPKDSKLRIIDKVRTLKESDLVNYARSDKFKAIEESSMTPEKAAKIVLGVAAGVTAGAVALSVGVFLAKVWLAYRGIKAIFDKCSRSCGVIGIGFKRKVCIEKCKIQLATSEIKLFGQAMAGCKRTQNPEQCKLKVQKKYEEARNTLEAATQALRRLEHEARSSGREVSKAPVDTTAVNIFTPKD